MKLFLFAAAFLVTTTGLLAQTMPVETKTAQKITPVEFKITKYSFGKIQQAKPTTAEFVFTNTSAKPVIIESVVAECGCTTPVFPKEPIMKGKTGIVKVTYNAANLGAFSKRVTVKIANLAEPVVLTIDGDVVASQK